MKKSLLLLFSLLIFVGNVWGACTETIVSSETSVSGHGDSKEYTLPGPCNYVTFDGNHTAAGVGDLIVEAILPDGTTQQVYKGNPGYYSWFEMQMHYESCSGNIDPTATKLRFKSSALADFKKYFKNVVVTKVRDVLSISPASIEAFPFTEKEQTCSTTRQISVYYSAPTKKLTITSVPTGFSVDKTTVISGSTCETTTKDITITFKPTIIGEQSGDIVFSNGTKVHVSGTGVLAAPTDLTVEGRGYDYALLKWTGSTGAEKYNIYSGSTLIGKTNNNSTTVKIEGLSLGTTYSNVVVKAVANNTESAASNDVTFSTYDLDKPQNLSSDASYAIISLFWESVNDATGYRIYNLTNKTYEDINLSTTSEGVVSYSESGLTANTEYEFKVVPMYGTSLSKSEAEITVKTTDLPPVPPTQACELYRDNTEYSIDAWKNCSVDYNFDDAMYKCDITFNAKYAIAFPWEFKKNTNLQAKVGDSWQTIWYEEDKIKDSYQEFKVSLPNGTTAVRFYTGGFYNSTQIRYYSRVVVKRRNELSVSDKSINFGTPYIGQSVERSLSINYSNIADMTAMVDRNDAFTANLNPSAACAYGTGNKCVITYHPVTVETPQQATLTIYNGLTKNISLTGGIKALPAPLNLAANATGKSNVTLTWEENPGDDNKALGLASGYYVRYKKSSAESYGDPVFVARKTEDTNYSHTVPSLEDGTEYNFKVTTIYTDSKSNKIENEYAEITTSTYSTVTVSKNGGISSVTPFYYITCSNSGSWNVNEKSFAKGATAVITPVQILECDKYKDANVNEGEPVTGETISFEVNTPSTVKLNYEFGLSTPVINSITVNGKSSVTLSWYNDSCSSSYTLFVYKSGEKRTIEGVSTPYTVTELEEGTDYEFALQAIRNDGETEYTSAESSHIPATTYSTLKVETDGEYAKQIEFTLAGEEGKWNSTEKSFAKDSKATITASLKEGVTCAIFDKILVGKTEYTENPAKITMTAPATATISYKFAGLEKPTVVVSENNSKDKISISWNSVDCAESYTVYNGDKEVATGIITATEYKFENLTPATEYQFKVKAVNGDKSAESDAVNATTYTTSMNVEVEGIFGSDQVVYSITSTAMNTDEQSYAIGSTATVGVTTLPASCVVDKIEANGVDISTTATFTVAAENNVKITYRYTGTGVAEVIGGQIYETLNAAVDAVQDGGTINLLGDVPTQDLSVSGKHIEFNGNGHSISNLYIESDGSVDLIGDVVVVNDFGLEISTSNSGQFTQTNAQIEVRGKAYVDKILDNSGVGDYNKWYSVAVPFPVSIANGIYILDNNGNEIKKAVLNKDYAIFEYDSELRAKGTSRLPEWKLAATENMKLGTFYLLGLGYSGPNVYRFYKLDDADLITAENQLEIKSYPASNPKNAGWNGIGNTKLFHIGIESPANNYAQVLEGNKFITVSLEDSKFAVTTPMFIQSDENTIATLSPKHNGSLRSVSASSDTYNLRIAKENADGYADQMFVSASDNVMEQYTIGKDLSKFEVSTLYPQIYTMAYGTALSVHEAAYNDKNIAEMPLYMFAPEAGNYTLSLGKDVLDGTALYLVKDGAEIHNFSNDGAYTLYLAKGTTSTYSLRISAATSDVPTIVEDENGSEIKIYVKEGVLVIEGLGIGESYNVGNMVRTLYYGVSNGGNITVPLSEQGVYWVKTGNKVVKVLNK